MKVFVMPDDAFDLAEYAREFDRISKYCAPLQGCCPCTRMIVSVWITVECGRSLRVTVV